MIAELPCVDTGKKVFARAEENGGNGEVHLVDETRAQILSDRRDAAAQPDVLTVRSFDGAFQCSVDAIADEVECSPAVHADRCAGVEGEHEDGRVVWRVVAPPSFPGVVGPWSSDRPEHVSTHDPRSDVGEAARCKVVVDAGRTAITSKHLPKRTGGEGPFVQGDAADAERIVQILVGTSAIPVEG